MMTKQEIEELIENHYELIWETTRVERSGEVKVVSRPVKVITVHAPYANSLFDYVREQKLGYRIFIKIEEK
jgi:hypothetical protein